VWFTIKGGWQSNKCGILCSPQWISMMAMNLQ